MTQSENSYRHDVFLMICGIRRIEISSAWTEHQDMQLSFLTRRGLTSSSTVLDLGCGPMRLGSALIPLLKDGWYFGQDINPSTIVFGEEVLRDVGLQTSSLYFVCIRSLI